MIQVRAKVVRIPRDPALTRADMSPWLAAAYVADEKGHVTRDDLYEVSWHDTVTEAILSAVAMRDIIDRKLMDEVNESRASRRGTVIDVTDDYDCELRTMEATA